LAAAALPSEVFAVDVSGSNGHDFANIELLFKEQKADGSFLDTAFKHWDKWHASDSLSFVGPGDVSLAKSFMVIGEYLNGDGGVGGVFVAMDNAAADGAIKLGSSFEAALKISDFSSLSELKIEDALQTGDTAVLQTLYKESSLLNNGAAQMLGTSTESSLVEFTTAAAGGTIIVSQSPVAEPATVWTMLAGLLALFGVRSSKPRRDDARR
jgi:hypothetical protein